MPDAPQKSPPMGELIFNESDHSYLLNGKNLVSVTQVIQSVGLINFDGISPDILRRAAEYGKAVHLACALADVGDLDEDALDENLRGPLDAWRSFRGGMSFDAIEQPLCHPDYGFAGIPDRIVGYPKPTIYDIKTGTTIYPSTAIQLAGYAILADIPTARRLAVQLKPDGKYQIHEYKDRKDREIFLACLAIYNWRIKNETM